MIHVAIANGIRIDGLHHPQAAGESAAQHSSTASLSGQNAYYVTLIEIIRQSAGKINFLNVKFIFDVTFQC